MKSVSQWTNMGSGVPDKIVSTELNYRIVSTRQLMIMSAAMMPYSHKQGIKIKSIGSWMGKKKKWKSKHLFTSNFENPCLERATFMKNLPGSSQASQEMGQEAACMWWCGTPGWFSVNCALSYVQFLLQCAGHEDAVMSTLVPTVLGTPCFSG